MVHQRLVARADPRDACEVLLLQVLHRELDTAERQLTAADHRHRVLERSALVAQAEADSMRVRLAAAEEYSTGQVRSCYETAGQWRRELLVLGSACHLLCRKLFGSLARCHVSGSLCPRSANFLDSQCLVELSLPTMQQF